jgi:hypothetical protein
VSEEQPILALHLALVRILVHSGIVLVNVSKGVLVFPSRQSLPILPLISHREPLSSPCCRGGFAQPRPKNLLRYGRRGGKGEWPHS